MIAVFLSPFYFLINGYLLYRIIKWLENFHDTLKKKRFRIMIVIVYVFFAMSMLIAFLLPSGKPRRIIKLISNYWLGVFMYMVAAIVAADLLRIIYLNIRKPEHRKLCTKKVFALVGSICAAIVLTTSLWGVANARTIHTTKYQVSIPKKVKNKKELKIVLAADLHLGYNIGCLHMKQMVRKINKQHPDLVVIAGDIFDNEYKALDHPKKLASILKGIKSKYGVYAVYGNHDIEEKILAGFTFGGEKKKASDPRMDLFLQEAGIHLLMDEAVLIDDSFYLYGRPDYERPGRGINKRKTPNKITKSLDMSKPVIVIDHEPRELEELAKAGVDMDLCGHTHDGQMFPGNIITSCLWENSCGYLKKGNMHNIVTSGVGLFGPNMRVGTIAEICSIKVTLKES